MTAEIYNNIFLTSLQAFIVDYNNKFYTPITEADIQFYLMALCKELMQQNKLPLDIHANYSLSNYKNFKKAKIDLVIGSMVAIEIKFEANYPGITASKQPVVFTKDAVADIQRLTDLHQAGIPYCHFLFLDEYGIHMRNLYKHTPLSISWKPLRQDASSHLLHISI